MDGRKYQPVVNVVEWCDAYADAGLTDQITDFLLQFAEGFNVIKFVELKEIGFDII